MSSVSQRKELGIGIIGYSIGKVHAHAWSAVDEFFHPAKLNPRLVAICGRNKENLEIEANRFGFESSYSDWKDLVEDDRVSVVDNCSPPSTHLEPTILAASLGKHLFCEKPMARNSAEAKAMLDAAEKARVKHMVGYNYRFIPAVILARDMITSGQLGNIFYFKGSYLNVNEGYDNPGFPYGWHHDSGIAGYGALADLGTHALDLARFLVGEISSVSGASETFVKERPVSWGSKEKRKVDVDDLTVACMKFQNGALGILESSWLTPGRMDFLSFEVYGSLGAIKYNLERIHELEVFKSEDEPKIKGFRNVMVLNKKFHPYMSQYWSNQGGGFAWEHSFINEANHLINCIADDMPVSPNGATFYDGYRNCRIMDGIAASAKSEKWVDVSE
ncbi:MAG TPA: Gfo/Idh/MocA family oxidoreductase [Nitrososphaerales archaeon]|nr:Gfo/Idh/MocA family oxidoreductase [Nitrososphaerales archaeon]